MSSQSSRPTVDHCPNDFALALSDVVRSAIRIRMVGEYVRQFQLILLCRRRVSLHGDRHDGSLGQFISTRQPQQVERTSGPLEMFLGNVQILDGGLQTLVAHQCLDGKQVNSSFQKMGRETVP